MSRRGRHPQQPQPAPAPDAVAPPASLLERLRRCKLFQWALAYAGAAWFLLQLLGQLSDFYAWPDVVGRAATILLLIGLVVALILAWYHGERGAQQVSAMELSLFALLAVIAGFGVWLVGGGLQRRGPDFRPGVTAAGGAPDSRSIAVLPFESVSPDSADGYIASGFHEELITTLAKAPELHVISRTSVMGYRGTRKNLRDIARELGVARILEGSVRRAGNRLRVTAQLIDARTDRHLWADTYDRELKDVFAIQTDLATRIAASLQASLTPQQQARMVKPLTRNQAAYDLYLRANTIGNIDSAVALYRRATRLDSSFAAAYAALALLYVTRGSSRLEWADTGLALARAAIAADPTYAPAYRMVAVGLRDGYHNLRESTVAIRRALDLDPRYGAAMNTLAANEGGWGGNYDEGVIWLARALPLDPRYPAIPANLGANYMGLGEYRTAESWLAYAASASRDWARPDQPSNTDLVEYPRVRLDLLRGHVAAARQRATRALAREPGSPAALDAAAVAAEAAGDWPAARRHAERLYAMEPNQGRLDLALALLRTGAAAPAQPLLDEELRRDQGLLDAGADAPAVLYRIAVVHVLRAERDSALDALERAHLLGLNSSRELAISPFFASVRDDPRFTRLVAHMDGHVRIMRERVAALEAAGQIAAPPR